MKVSVRLVLILLAVLLLLLVEGWNEWRAPLSEPSASPTLELAQAAESPTPTIVSATPSPAPTTWPTATLVPTPTLTPLPTATPVHDVHFVRSGETLGGIADTYGMTMEELTALNGLQPGDWLAAGEALYVTSHISRQLPSMTLIPDSEVVNGATYVDFDLEAYIQRSGGYLSQYDEWGSSGAEVIDRVSRKFYIGPRVLLGALEVMSGWVIGGAESPHPYGYADGGPPNLAWQAERAARRLAEGYYGQLDGRRDWVSLQDGTRVRLAPGTNPGTAAVLNFLADAVPSSEFEAFATAGHFQATYNRLFGEVEGGPVMPPFGEQPELALPFKEQSLWYFSGGPHGGYGDRISGWAAVDFAPPVAAGCYVSPYAVRSISPGQVVSIGEGELWIDMDGDHDIRTGWAIFYMHLYTEGILEEGQRVAQGDILGYPSCLGGVSSGAHVHVARMYNGQWMPAAGAVPFEMEGWVVRSGTVGASYDGYLVKRSNLDALEACECRSARRNRFPERPRVGGP